MSPSRHRMVAEITADALELPPEQRSSYIANACGGDAEMEQSALRLVAAAEDSRTGLLDRAPVFAVSSEPLLAVGTLLAGRFRIRGLLARGGMGEVYRACDEELHEDVALKIIGADLARQPGIVGRFRHEVQRARWITHPNVCRIHDLETHTREDGSLLQFLTMQLIFGPTLVQLMQRSGKLAVTDALHLLEDVLGGLEAAHNAGVAHCDLKPSNILVDESNPGRPRAIITDFGLARALQADANGDDTCTGIVGGVAAYMAPELRFSNSGGTVAGDIFAFGVIAYELLTGVHPFNGRSQWEMSCGFLVTPPRALVPEIPSNWAALILRCMEPDAASRFSRVEEVRAAVTGDSSLDRSARIWETSLSRRRLPYAAAALVAGTAGIAGYLRWRRPPEVIAVLPFENTSRDSNLDYLGEGITETLINSLSQVPRLHIPAVGLVRRFGADVSPVKAGQALKASSILTGRVRRHNALLTVEVELIDVASGHQIWGKQYNLAWTNVLDVQESICTGILSSLQIRLGEQDTKKLRRGLTGDEEAFQSYLRGEYLLGLRTESSLKDARNQFGEALQRDPNFALAHAALAGTRLLLGYWGLEKPLEAMPAASTASQRALALEPSLAEAYSVLGAVKAMYEWDWRGAEASFRKAIALKEDLAEAHHWYARFVLGPLARFTEAISEMKRALNWDPYGVILHANLGYMLYVARRYDDAVAQAQRVTEMNPSFELGYRILGQVWALKGNLAKAVEAHETARRLQPGPKVELSLAYCYGACGKRSEGSALLATVLQTYHEPAYTATELAMVQSAVGKVQDAFRSLETAWSRKDPQLIEIGADPKFDGLRGHPAYASILRTINLDPDVYTYKRLLT